MSKKFDFYIPEECKQCPLQSVIAAKFEDEAAHIRDLVEASEIVEHDEAAYCKTFEEKIESADDIDTESAKVAVQMMRNVLGKLLHKEMCSTTDSDIPRLNELREYRDELNSTCRGPQYLKHESEGGDKFHLIACTAVKAYVGSRTSEVLGMEGVMTVIEHEEDSSQG